MIGRNGLSDLISCSILLFDLKILVNHAFSLTYTLFGHKVVHKCSWHQATFGLKSTIYFVVVSSDVRLYVLVKRG